MNRREHAKARTRVHSNENCKLDLADVAKFDCVCRVKSLE